MNKKSLNISDHLLVKFFEGKTNAFETDAVLSYLNEDKENLEDFMNIHSALQIESDYPTEIDINERLGIVKQHLEIGQNISLRPANKRFYLITSFAAAAMIAGVVCLLVFLNPEKTNNFIAQGDTDKDSMQNITSDTINEPLPLIQNISKNDLADNELQNTNVPLRKNNSDATIPEEEEQELQIQIQHQNMARKIEANLFEMVKPAKTPYIVSCKNLEKTFDFKWNTNAEKIDIVLKDKNGKILLTKEVTQNGFSIKYLDYYKYLEIRWEFKATFESGETATQKGVLQLMVE